MPQQFRTRQIRKFIVRPRSKPARRWRRTGRAGCRSRHRRHSHGHREILKQKIKKMKLFAVEQRIHPCCRVANQASTKSRALAPVLFSRGLNRDVNRPDCHSYDEDAGFRSSSRRAGRILCGISSGAISHASCIVAQELGREKRVLAILLRHWRTLSQHRMVFLAVRSFLLS